MCIISDKKKLKLQFEKCLESEIFGHSAIFFQNLFELFVVLIFISDKKLSNKFQKNQNRNTLKNALNLKFSDIFGPGYFFKNYSNFYFLLSANKRRISLLFQSSCSIEFRIRSSSSDRLS